MTDGGYPPVDDFLTHASDVGGEASASDIAQAEAELGVALPATLRAFLSRAGWAAMEANEYFGIGAGVPEYIHLVRITLAERHELEPGLPTHLIPLRGDGAGNLYALDLDRGSPDDPSVVFWEHDGNGVPLQVSERYTDWLKAETADRK